MNGKLCDTPVTEAYLAERLSESLGPNAVLRAVSGERIAVGQGFVSTILRVRLTWETPEGLPTTAVVKIPAVDSLNACFKENVADEEKARQTVVDVVNAFHSSECAAYSIFREYAPVPVPKCYAATVGEDGAPGVIVMEDLCSKASVIPCIIAGLSLTQLVNATTALAQLHGWSLTTSVDWRGRVKDLDELRPAFEPVLANSHPGYRIIKEKYPEYFGSIDPEELIEFLTFDKLSEYSNGHRRFMEDVLVHGDFWANNIMFEKKPDGTVGDEIAALVDWQLAARGSPMADLARVMSWSVSPEIRRAHIYQLLHHYYSVLKSIAGDKVTVTVGQMKYWYDRQFAFNVLWIVTNLNIFAEKFAKGEGEQNLRDQMAFVERMKANYDDAMTVVRNDRGSFSKSVLEFSKAQFFDGRVYTRNVPEFRKK